MANTLKFGNGEWYGKKDAILAYNDENNNYKPLPFDFSRGSTATVVNKDGLIETVGSGEPRIDYKDNTKGALLLEPSRTNLVPYSEDFSQWNKSNVAITITTNYGLSPDGLNNSSRVQFTDASQHINISTSLGTGVTSTGSVYIKGTLGEIIRFDTGGVGGLKTLTGDWQRIEVTSTSVSSLLLINTFGGATARDIQVFGAQCEQASYATSYIPTQGSVVTRLADSCSQTVPDGVIGQTEGTIFVSLNLGESTTDTISTPIRFSLNNGVSSDNWIFVGNESGDNLRVYVRANASTSVDFTKNNVFPSSGNYKIAMSFKSNETKCYVNGVLQYNGSLGIIPNNLNSIGLGSVITGDAVSVKSQIKEYKLYNTALTDQELQALTTI